MQRQCSGTTKAGERCKSFAASDSSYCVAHDPARPVELSEWRKKGGESRSNANRARKSFNATTGRIDVAAKVLETMRKVENGEMEHGPANAIASLARAYVAVIGDSEVEDRITELRRMIEELKAS